MPRWLKPKQAATVIRKHGPSKEFSGPSTFQGTGQFSANQFKAEDKGSPR